MVQEQCLWQCDRVIPSHAAAARRMLAEVLENLKQHGWSEHDIFAVELAMHEALANALVHGNREDPQKEITVRCRLSSTVLHAEIADQGEGFDPATVPNPADPRHLAQPRGRGIMLMRAFMCRVEYNQRGNQVILEKRRTDLPDRPSSPQSGTANSLPP
jgi:serine/threonine-protein kinase RsbW